MQAEKGQNIYILHAFFHKTNCEPINICFYFAFLKGIIYFCINKRTSSYDLLIYQSGILTSPYHSKWFHFHLTIAFIDKPIITKATL